MATNFASLIAQQGLTNTAPANAPDAVGAWAQGAQIANQRMQLEQAKADNAQKMQQLQFSKLEKLGSFLDLSTKMPEGAAKQAFVKDYIPNYIQAVGLGDVINPTSLKMLQGDPQVSAYLKNEIEEGRLDFSQLTSVLGNPDQLAELIPGAAAFATGEQLQTGARANLGELQEAAKFATEQAAISDRSRDQIRAQQVKQQEEIAAAGPKTVATKVAELYTDWDAGGGRVGVEASIKNMEEALQALETGAVQTGDITTKIPFFQSDNAQSMLNPEMQAVKQQARSSMLSSMRQILGSAYTEREGDNVMNTVWDDKQPPRVNAAKLRRKIEEFKLRADAAERQFRRFGYLDTGGPETSLSRVTPGRSITPAQGEMSSSAPASFRSQTPQQDASTPPPTQPSLNDFRNASFVARMKAFVAAQPGEVEKLAKAYGLNAAQFKIMLGVQ